MSYEEIDDLAPKQNLWDKALARKNVNGKNLLVVDMNNLAYRYKQRGQVDFQEDMIRTVESLAKSYSALHIVCAWDHRSSSYRKSIYPGYKGGRKEKYKDQTPEEKLQAEMFFNGLDEAYQHMVIHEKNTGFVTNFKFEFVEADDPIALTVQVMEPFVDHIWVISTDQDFCQLISNKVSLFAYKSRKEFTLDTMFEYTNADSGEQHLFIKCLQGDSGDSVPGVPDVGPKRGYGLAREYGDIFSLIAALPIEGKQKYIVKLNEFGASNLMLNLELMDLKSYCATAIAHPHPANLDYMFDKLEKIKEIYNV